jgi:tripartite-type tricarboxylate transporter receptor subunit TctC
VRENGGSSVTGSGFLIAAYLLAAATASGAAENIASGSAYPSRPIRLLVGFSPGGATDVVARILGKKLSEAWGQQVVIDNRSGAAGIVATEITAKANPDGYTLLFVSSSFAIQPSVTPKLPYDSLRDFSPITLAVSAPYLLIVNPTLEAKSVRELIDVAKARPGQISCATAGPGSALHLAAELFSSMAGIDIVYVPYKGAVGITDLLAGHVQMAFAGLPQSLPHTRSGRLRALAVTTPARSAVLPEIPTLAEAGVPGYDVTVWYGMIAPARTPRAVIGKLHSGVANALKAPDVRQILTELGIDPVGSTPDQFAVTIRHDLEKWLQMAKRPGARSN